MRTQPIKKPTLMPQDLCKNDPQKAVAILAEFTAKYQGGNRAMQNRAAIIAVNLLQEGVPALKAIQSAVRKVLQQH
jgi:hypothetical protein